MSPTRTRWWGRGQSIVSRLQARQALEIASGVLAIRNASESDRIKLKAVRVELSEALEIEDYQWYLVVTFDLHELIAKISHNSYLEEATRDVVEPMRNDEWALNAYLSALWSYASQVTSVIQLSVFGVIILLTAVAAIRSDSRTSYV